MNQFIQRFMCRVAIGLAIVCGSVPAHAYDGDWNFNIGGGFSPVVGGLDSQLTSGWNFAVGTGYDFDDHLGVLLEFQNHEMGVENGILDRYSTLFGGADTDGETHIWSVTVNPTWKFQMNRVVGGYFIGGGGYVHVNAQVTTPTIAFAPGYCDPWWGCWPGGFVAAERTVAERKDDTGGLNVGMGFTFDFWHDVQFYIESRYHYLLIHGPDLQLLPLTAGFRF